MYEFFEKAESIGVTNIQLMATNTVRPTATGYYEGQCVWIKTFKENSRCWVDQDGLKQLRAYRHTLIVPILYADEQMLIEPFIDSIRPCSSQWKELGTELAMLHSKNVNETRFGLNYNNFIGAHPQENHWHRDWSKFYISQRLAPQLAMLPSVYSEVKEAVESIYPLVHDLVGQVKAAPLHGDLWMGNVLFSTSGPKLIDPAFYYGDSRTDLAMLELFGTIPKVFYEAYQAVCPIAGDWRRLKALYQLYHLLNHLNLFGRSYLSGVGQAIRCIKKG